VSLTVVLKDLLVLYCVTLSVILKQVLDPRDEQRDVNLLRRLVL
jgi:hypothetical protein